MAAVSRRDRRTLIAGAVTIATLIGIARGGPAVRTWRLDQLDQARAAAVEVATLRANETALPALRESVSVRRARLARLDSSLLTAPSPAGIGAELASAVEQLADENSIKVLQLQLRSDSVAIGGLARAEVRLSAIGDVAGLAEFLAAAEGGATPLVVRELGVSQPDPAASDSKPEALRVDVLVAGIGAVRPVQPRAP